MEIFLQVIDWILRITGLASIIIILINLFINDFEYIDNVKIIANPTEEELNKCKNYEEYSEEEKSYENTLFLPLSCNVKVLKLYSLKLTEEGKLKKEALIKKYKNLEPYYGVIFNAMRTCAAPRYLLEWKIDYGYKGKEIVQYNGFNGNDDKEIVKYHYGFISKIRKILMIK